MSACMCAAYACLRACVVFPVLLSSSFFQRAMAAGFKALLFAGFYDVPEDSGGGGRGASAQPDDAAWATDSGTVLAIVRKVCVCVCVCAYVCVYVCVSPCLRERDMCV
jgi:hypothetical protein